MTVRRPRTALDKFYQAGGLNGNVLPNKEKKLFKMEKSFWICFLINLCIQIQGNCINDNLRKEQSYGKGRVVIVDTDTAVDDAMGLTVLLTDPGWQVIAVTTIFGNVNLTQATINARRTLNVLKKTNIPVYQGAEKGFNSVRISDNFFGEDGMGGKGNMYPTGKVEVQKEVASRALARYAKELPGKVTIVVLGPLTNLALAQRYDPEFLSNVKEIHIMGGSVNATGNLPDGYPLTTEFNFAQDPEAASIVLSETPQNKLQIFTWDMCLEGGVSWSVFDKMVSQNSIPSRFIGNIVAKNAAADKKTQPTFSNYCDFFATIATVNPKSIGQLDSRYAVVELKGEFTRGMMVVDKNPHSKYNKQKLFNIKVISRVDTKEIEKSIMAMATWRG